VVSADDVIEILDALDAAGVTVWVDGGWGVDALLGEERRAHDDLDVAIARTDCNGAVAALAPLGFGPDEGEAKWWPARLVLRDGRGRQIDVHPLIFDDEGNGRQEFPAWVDWIDREADAYPADGLRGVGRVGGRAVRCLTAEAQVLQHAYADPDDVDYEDMTALADRFGVQLPPAYSKRPGWVDGRRSVGIRSFMFHRAVARPSMKRGRRDPS